MEPVGRVSGVSLAGPRLGVRRKIARPPQRAAGCASASGPEPSITEASKSLRPDPRSCTGSACQDPATQPDYSEFEPQLTATPCAPRSCRNRSPCPPKPATYAGRPTVMGTPPDPVHGSPRLPPRRPVGPIQWRSGAPTDLELEGSAVEHQRGTPRMLASWRRVSGASINRTAPCGHIASNDPESLQTTERAHQATTATAHPERRRHPGGSTSPRPHSHNPRTDQPSLSR